MNKKYKTCFIITLTVICLLVLFVIHISIFIPKLPIVNRYFTIDNASWMDGPFVYGQYTISPYTNKAWWGNYGGTNRSWGIYTHKKWPLLTFDWSTMTVDSNGNWH